MRKRKIEQVDYIAQYWADIQSGRAIVGKWIRLLYQRITDGIADGTYLYDIEKACAAIDYIETHGFHTEGWLAQQNLRLEIWQKAMLACLYGIIDPANGKRMFRTLCLIIGRKNGKSALSSSIAKMEFYRQYSSRVYCIAPKLEQADIVYNGIWQQIAIDPEYIKLAKRIDESRDEHNKRTISPAKLPKRRQSDIYLQEQNATIKKLAYSGKRMDGFSPTCVILDEFAAYTEPQGSKVFEAMASAFGAREMGDEPPIMIACSTANYINDSVYDALMNRSTRFLLGESKEKRLLPVIYMIDDAEKWNDITEIRKANPNLGISTSEDFMREEIARASGSYSAKAEFLCKYCCVKQNAQSAWLRAEHIEKCFTGEPLLLEDFTNNYCVAGVDLSKSYDLTAACIIVEKGGKLNTFAHFWLPANMIEEATARDGMPYRAFIERGLLSPSGENAIDYSDCFAWLAQMVEQYHLYPVRVGYDKWNALEFTKRLQGYGFYCDDVTQGFNLTPVIASTEAAIKDGLFNFGDNDLLKAHLLSTALKTDTDNGKRKIVKIAEREHIDGTAALLDAMCMRAKYVDEIGEQLKNE